MLYGATLIWFRAPFYGNRPDPVKLNAGGIGANERLKHVTLSF